MASLQVRHSRKCPAYGTSGFTLVDDPRCTCQATYYTVVSKDGKVIKERVGKVRRAADKALKILNGKVASETYEPVKNIRFDRFADEWLERLTKAGKLKANAIDDYRTTINLYAKPALGRKVVRKLTTADIDAFLSRAEEGGASVSTRAKHLTNLRVCLNSAVKRSYASFNPIDQLEDNARPERPKPGDREAAYFEDGELGPLFREIKDGLYRTLFQVALATGMRQGEIVALRWSDIGFTENQIHVRRSYTNGRETTPKSGKVRHVTMTPELVTALAVWKNEFGDPPKDQLVFPGADGYISTSTLTKRVLYPAMKRAGIDRIGPTGEKRTFHSLRHTFARIVLENGQDLYRVSAHLGHSSYKITEDVYGHFSKAAHQKHAASLEGAFEGAFQG